MSHASRETLSSSDVGREISVIWLGTFYYDLMPHCIANMTRDVIWKSDSVRPTYVNILLEFQFVRLSELDFNITCFRYHGTQDGCQTPTGYTLQFQCSINLFSEEEPKVFEMQSHEFVIVQRFSLHPSYLHFFSPLDLNKPFEIKILVKMIEYDCVKNSLSVDQNEHLHRLQDRWFNFTSVLMDLAYILHIPRFENIYTGRQNMAFSDVKTVYIKNTAHYSKEVADYLRAKESCVAVPVTDLGLILNFIFNGKREQISDDDLFEVYVVGHLMGLNFLVELARDRIIGRLPKNIQWVNHSFLLEALKVSDRVNDEILFEKAAEKFQKWERELENPEAIFDVMKSMGIKGRFMLYSLTRRSRKIEAGRQAVDIGESSQISPIQYITLQ